MAPSSPNAEPSGQLIVLIVDDNASNLKLARDVLRADGITTIEATTGAEAIEVATGGSRT